MLIDYGKGEVEIEVSPLTMLVYEQEFGSDLIHDFWGKVSMEEDGTPSLDFRKQNWTAAVKALWACRKAADERTEPLMEWARKLGDINVAEVYGALDAAIASKLFRSGAADSE